MEKHFNEQQQRVIEAQGGYHLVLAPPGCGKTAVLAERVVWARRQGISYDRMACLTFTNRAARGMKERIWARMGESEEAEATGATGANGATKATGADGADGADGATKATGATGATGADGAAKATGAGASGATGAVKANGAGANGPYEQGLDELFVGNVHRFCSQFLFQSGVLPEQAAIIETDMSMSILADYLGEDELQVLGEAKHRQRYSQMINLQHLMYQCCHHYPSELMVHRDALSATALRELCVAFALPYSQASTIELYLHADHYRDEGAVLSSEAHQLLTMLYAARRYEEYKRRNDLADFEDLLLLTYDAMTAAVPYDATVSHPTEQAGPQTPSSQQWRRYDWIQVDEVQDLNPLQLAIIDLFANEGATVVYLGDSQQAIFSFMGAKTDTLQLLRQRCQAGCLHNFYENYRSPAYLLQVFNAYGERQLGIGSDLLPVTQNVTPRQPGDLVLMDAATNIDEVNMVARRVRQLYEQHPDETTAVVVAFNSDADEVSAALGGLPHFKISGVDLFATIEVRLLLAHLSVLSMEHNFIAWAQLLAGLKVFQSNAASRQFVHALMEQAVSPADFLLYDGSTYVAEFVRSYEQQDLVVFDTETTGLSVFHDDVVQLAAVRVRRGEVVDRLNLFIETDREIPPMLGEVVNPLLEEYGRHEHLSHREALHRFADFACGAAILGHNATYDYQIMEHNMRRYAPELSMHRLWPAYWDSLKLIRLLRPRLQSYKLKSLLETLQLEGANSHLADDDIMATLSLVNYCYEDSRERVGRQLEFISRHRHTAEKLRERYGELYRHGADRLFVETTEPALSRELLWAYHYLEDQGRVGELPKLDYIMRYVEIDLLTPESGLSLAEQLARHMPDLMTMKEADLCGAMSMQERVFVSTVHKAKGLEFDNVIVFDAVEGKYPSVYADTETKAQEEARKFYVAISRARRRLVVSYCRQSINRWGRMFPKVLTPYMVSIKSFFDVS